MNTSSDLSCEQLRLQLAYKKNEFRTMTRRMQEKTTRPPVSPEDLSRIRKILFGPVDVEDNKRFLNQQVKRLDVIQKERWNFDFKKEEQLRAEGSFKWVKESPKKRIVVLAPKPRRLAQAKLTEFLPIRKMTLGEPVLKKLKTDDDEAVVPVIGGEQPGHSQA